MSSHKKIRVLLTKSDMDGHDRGVKLLAHGLRDAGMEVIFTRFALVEELAKIATEEHVDVVGLSSSSGGHLEFAEDLMSQLKKEGMEDTLVLFGGVIPNFDVPELKQIGVAGVFGPGSALPDIADFITEQKG